MGADSDAEWIDVNEVLPRPGPNRPPPRPRTTPAPSPTTFRPRPRPGQRPRRPFGPRHDAPDRAPPSGSSYKATTISLSVISALFLVALVMILLYLFVLKKKLKKVKRFQSDSQYSLRVEDVAHLDTIDDSSKLYVNTTDLQKLVSSIRVKNKKPPPPLPLKDAFPDVVQVGTNNVAVDTEIYSTPTFDSHKTGTDNVSSYQHTDEIYANVSFENNSTPYIARAAPPPPFKVPNGSSNPSVGVIGSPNVATPPTLPKPKKPTVPPPSCPTLPKPSLGQSSRKPLLPPLKLNLAAALMGHNNSGASTPDTAISYVADTPEPEMLSVRAKRALLEGAIGNNGV